MRFNPTFYTTTETKGNVTVWIHVDKRVNEPFTVALIPGKGDVNSIDVYINLKIENALFYMQGLRSLLITIN